MGKKRYNLKGKERGSKDIYQRKDESLANAVRRFESFIPIELKKA